MHAGPLEQEVGGQWSPEFLPTQVQCLGEVLFEQGLQAIGQAGALIDHGPAMAHELLEPAGLGIFRLPELELGVVGEQQYGQVAGILGVVLGAGGDKGLAILLEGDGVDGVEADPVDGFQEADEVQSGLF